MRSLVFMTAALIIYGSNSSVAQQIGPGMRARPPTALGAVSAAPLGRITGGRLGAVVPCATSGVPAVLFNGSTADPFTGALPPPLLPGATTPAAPSFGASTTSGICDASASTGAVLEAWGSSVSVTLPGLATITGSSYADAVRPSAATEVGGPGQAPLIVVPAPVVPSASPCVGDATMPIGGTTDPAALAMASGAAVAASSGVSPPFGC